MNLLLDISALIKLAAVFVLIIALIRLRFSIGNALTAGTVAVGLWFGLPPLSLFASMARTLVSERTLALCGVVGLILVLSRLMEKTGHMERLLEAFRRVSGNVRLNLALFPALIGLLPMPGGAVFSAPMVQAVSRTETIDPDKKTLINYWFRHIWEFSWPLYPGVILTCALSGIDLATFVLVQLPLTLATAFIGYVGLLRGLPEQQRPPRVTSRKDCAMFVLELVPLLIVITGALLIGSLVHLARGWWPPLENLSKEYSLIAALVAAIGWVAAYNHVSPRSLVRLSLNKSMLSMLYMIAGVMMFQGILNDSRAVEAVSRSLTAAHVPVTLVIVILPFLVGGIAGVTVAFVGATFPILFSLLSHAGLSQDLLAYTILAFCSGYLGVLVSPLHICLILTCGFFKTNLTKIILRLVPFAVVLGLAGTVSFWIHRTF